MFMYVIQEYAIITTFNNKLKYFLSNFYVLQYFFKHLKNITTEQLFMEQRRVLFCGFNDLLSAQIKYNGGTLKRVIPALLTDISKTNFFIKAD